MKVKYRGYKYRVRFWHGILFHILSVWLHLKRTFRRAAKLVSFISPVLFLVPVWVVFIVILSLIEKQSIICYLDECKYSVFSSVVIAAIVRLQGKVPEYRKNLRIQHEMYVSLMGDADSLIEYIFDKAVSNDDRAIEIPDWPLYTIERYRKANEALQSCSVSNSISEAKVNAFLTLILDDISALRVMNGKGGLQATDDIDYHIDCAHRRLKEFQTTIAEQNVDMSILEHTMQDLFFLIDEIRYPWRREAFVNKVQRIIIAENNPDPEDRGHYFNLFEVI